jgi:hypothetical protein
MLLFIVEEQESSPEETEISRRDEFRPDIGGSQLAPGAGH